MPNSTSTIPTASVIGAGAWGTTLARHLAQQGKMVHLWAHEPEVVHSILSKRENSLFLPGVALPENLIPTNSLNEAIHKVDLILLAVPSHVMRKIVQTLVPLLSSPVPLVIATKGIEEGSLKLMSQVLNEILPPPWTQGITVLTGPTFAAEVCQHKPATVLLAGQDSTLTADLQAVFMSPSFRVYTGTDLIGAQLGGALKNVMAIAAGVVDGLGLGMNARAALITRGLTEIIRLGLALGGDLHTLYGLSGLGDLVLTCTGSLSRNHTVGFKLGKGQTLDAIQQDTKTIAEGVRTTRAAVDLAMHLQVDMPIAQSVYAILFQGKSSQQVVTDLMTRAAKEEAVLSSTKTVN
ncbi:MAG: NAD(P)H-dependent glycerol-3-phosphate dehydrogenase [Nitrospirota bacterium]|nr:NAD(P)H-dependent glycerol-3-phosphate dehydrogenase [Nitrospirota bacterium]